MSGIGGHVSRGQRRYDAEHRQRPAPRGWREELEAWRQQLLADGADPARWFVSVPRQEGRTALLRQLIGAGRVYAPGPPFEHRLVPQPASELLILGDIEPPARAGDLHPYTIWIDPPQELQP